MDRVRVPGSLVLLVWRWVLLAWLMWRIGEAHTVAQLGALRSRPMQDAAVLGAVKARPGNA
jgi:hypothetical protein